LLQLLLLFFLVDSLLLHGVHLVPRFLPVGFLPIFSVLVGVGAIEVCRATAHRLLLLRLLGVLLLHFLGLELELVGLLVQSLAVEVEVILPLVELLELSVGLGLFRLFLFNFGNQV
jgi:hypothetical protein